MITNFEEITPNISDDEKQLIKPLLMGFNSHGPDNPIKAKEIVAAMNKFLPQQGIKMKMTEPRLRRCVNYIRSESIIPLIATSLGYFVSYDPAIIESQIKSLCERASAIKKSADGMYSFLAKQ